MNIALWKEHYLVLPTFLVSILKKFSLGFEDFLLLSYFWNYKEEVFDVQNIANVLRLTENEVLLSFNNLLTKKLIGLNTKKDGNGRIIEIINLENLYQEIAIMFQSEKKEEEKQDIFSIFEQEFGRPISSMEYEIINGWLEKDFSEELILGALKEAVYNGVSNLRYIDKILYEWQRKGYKSMNEVSKDNFHRTSSNDKSETKELFDYNWLEDNDR